MDIQDGHHPWFSTAILYVLKGYSRWPSSHDIHVSIDNKDYWKNVLKKSSKKSFKLIEPKFDMNCTYLTRWTIENQARLLLFVKGDGKKILPVSI